MRRLVAAALLAAASAASSASVAEPATPTAHAAHGKKFPMAPEAFRVQLEGRIGKLRDRLEKAIGKRKVKAEKAQAARQSFNQGVVHVRTKLAAAAQDGKITREEARELQGLVRHIPVRVHLPLLAIRGRRSSAVGCRLRQNV